MTTQDDLDFSVRSVPDSWVDAASSEQMAGRRNATRRGSVGRASARPGPFREKVDLFSGSFLGLAAAFIFGIFWYFYETQDGGSTWWMPMIAGSVIAISVRAGAGRASPGLRFAVSGAIFSLAVLAAGLMIAQSNLMSQRVVATVETLESQLVFDQFTRRNSWLGLAGGILLMALLSFASSKRT